MASFEESTSDEKTLNSVGRMSSGSEATMREGDAKRTLEVELDRALLQHEEFRKINLARCEELERNEKELKAQVSGLRNLASQLEEQAAERERDASEQLSEAASQLRSLQKERNVLSAEVVEAKRALEMQKEVEREARELHIREAARCQQLESSERELREKVRVLARRQENVEKDPETRRLNFQLGEAQEKLREMQLRRGEAEAEQQLAVHERDRWSQKHADAEREISLLQRTCQDQKRALWDVEGQLRMERDAANVCSPGEYLRLARTHEDFGLSSENGRLKKELMDARCELAGCRRRLVEQDEVRLVKAGA